MVEILKQRPRVSDRPSFSEQRKVVLERSRVVTPEQKEQRIKVWMGLLMIAAALTLDVIETMLDLGVVGWVLSPLLSAGAGFGFWLWFQILGVSYSSSSKRFVVMGFTSLAEVIPALDTIPILSFFWTVGVLATVLITWAEDNSAIIGVVGGIAKKF